MLRTCPIDFQVPLTSSGLAVCGRDYKKAVGSGRSRLEAEFGTVQCRDHRAMFHVKHCPMVRRIRTSASSLT